MLWLSKPHLHSLARRPSRGRSPSPKPPLPHSFHCIASSRILSQPLPFIPCRLAQSLSLPPDLQRKRPNRSPNPNSPLLNNTAALSYLTRCHFISFPAGQCARCRCALASEDRGHSVSKGQGPCLPPSRGGIWRRSHPAGHPVCQRREGSGGGGPACAHARHHGGAVLEPGARGSGGGKGERGGGGVV